MSAPLTMPLGPVMLDIPGHALTDDDRRRLRHPFAGGVILFSRNYQSPQQLSQLTSEIHALRHPSLLIAVDHEGGRVQRFRDGFTILPPMRELGVIWEQQPQRARHLAQEAGWILAAELRASGVDFSFTPVLDIDHNNNGVIGNRAFHRNPEAVADLAHHLMIGLKQGGMPSVGKHFPGHGYAEADSHVAVPLDERSYADIELEDLIPFQRLIGYGLAAIMPAHVVYPKVDKSPAGFSKIWLKEVLRGQLGFQGTIFSDDLSMEGASVVGDVTARADAAFSAGCDMVLLCNNLAAVDELLDGLHYKMPAASLARLARMHGKPHAEPLSKLRENPAYVKALHHIGNIGSGSGNLVLEMPALDKPT